jgi:arylsulfatase A-like enzyme/Tfp pilus assembly protein PilF
VFHREGARILLLGGLLLGLGAGCGHPTPRTDVLLLTIDTLRGDRWGCLGDPLARTPVADRLARGGLLAFEGRAPAPVTLPSHTTLLTGVDPAVHGVRDNGIFRLGADAGVTVAEVLRDAGWTTGALVSAFPLAERFGLGRGFDHYDAFLGGGEGADAHVRERRAERTVARTRRWLEGPKAPPADRPLFAWVHFFDPHSAYDPPAPWAEALPDPYRGEVAYADRQAGRLLRLLAEKRERPLRVVVASDHGEALGEHGEPSHGVLLHLVTIRVPIVVRTEEYAPALLADPVGLDRVAATLLRLAGETDGLDPTAAGPLAPGRDGAGTPAEDPRPVFAETLYPWFNYGWRGLRSCEEGEWRLVSGERDRLYHVPSDPGEVRDLAPGRPELAEALREELERGFERAAAEAWRAEERTLSPEEAEALRALGYAAGGAAASAEEGFVRGPDPHGRIEDLVRVNAAVAEFDAGAAARAEAELLEIVGRDPANRMALEYLGRARLAQGDASGAREAFGRALGLGPNPEHVWLDLATAERQLGNAAGEEEALRGALGANPQSALAHVRLAGCLLDSGRPEEAVELLRQAAALRPRVVAAQVSIARLLDSLGRRDEARPYWERVLELEPEGPAAALARDALAGRSEAEGGSR